MRQDSRLEDRGIDSKFLREPERVPRDSEGPLGLCVRECADLKIVCENALVVEYGRHVSKWVYLTEVSSVVRGMVVVSECLLLLVVLEMRGFVFSLY